MGWLSGYANRLKFEIDCTKIDSDLTHFPLTLFLTESNADEVFTEVGSSYKKIGITQADGTTQLYVEVEEWDSSSKEAVLHISRSGWTISSSQNTVFYLYYDSSAADNTSYVGDIGDTPAQNVWNSNFTAVYHLCQDPSGGTNCIKDSTSNANHGTPQGSMTSGDLVEGMVGKALDFDGSDDKISIPSSLVDNNLCTLFSLFKADSTYNVLVGKGASGESQSTNLLLFKTSGANTMKYFYETGSGTNHTYTHTYTNDPEDHNWHLGVLCIKSGAHDLWLDLEKKSGTSGNSDSTATTAYIGDNGSGNEEEWNGLQDEVRCMSITPSDAWIKATYYSLFNQLVSTAQDSDSIEFKIDHIKIDSDLTHFPVTLFLNSANAGEIFQELAYPLNDDFSGADGDAPNTKLWTVGAGSPSISSNKLRFVLSGTDADSVKSNYKLKGDFDVQIDFDVLDGPSIKSWVFEIRSRLDNGKKIGIARGYGDFGSSTSHKYFIDEYDGSSWLYPAQTNTTDTTGKLRIVRSGSNFSLYYWGGSSWTQLGSPINLGSDDCYLEVLCTNYASHPDVTVDADNFTVNSGTEVWPGTGNQAHPNRKKLTIVSGTVPLYVEVEDFQTSLQRAVLHISSSDWTISSSEDTSFLVYYSADDEDNSYVGDIGDTPAQNVWDSNFKGVWHLSQNPTGGSGCIKDSTSNGRNFTPQGSMTYDDREEGKVGYALDFDGSNDYLQGSDWFYSNVLTVEAVFKSDVVGDFKNIALKRNLGTSHNANEWVFGLGSSGDILFTAWGSSGTSFDARSTSIISSGVWYYGAGRCDGSTAYSFLNLEKGTGKSQVYTIQNTSSEIQVGCRSANNDDRWFDGPIDEVRISNVARSDAWLKATYYSLFDSLVISFFSVLDNAQGLDTGSVAVSLSTSDASSGLETEAVAARIPISDILEGTDSLSPIEASIPVTDLGTGTDSISSLLAAIIIQETGSASDQPAIDVSLALSDSVSGSDSLDVSVLVAQTDNGIGTESTFAALLVSLTDNGVGTEAITRGILVIISDVGVGGETLTATLYGYDIEVADAGQGTEDQLIRALVSVLDSVHGLETLTLFYRIEITDSGIGESSLALSIQDKFSTPIITKTVVQTIITKVIGSVSITRFT